MHNFMEGARPQAGRLLAIFLFALAGACCAFVLLPGGAHASKSQWSVFEDHPWIVQTDPATRERTLNEVVELGADTVRVEVKWNEVAPASSSKTRPAFDATNPSAYPGFAPYDEAVRGITARGLRVLLTITGDAPRWATSGGRGGNYKPNAAKLRAVRDRGRQALLGHLLGRAEGGLLHDLERAQPHPVHQADLAGAAGLPQAGRRRVPALKARRPRRQGLRR